MIANNVRRIIKEKGLVQKTLAENAGINYKTFNRILNSKSIKDENILFLCKVLKVSPNELFGWDDKRKED